MFLLFLYHRHFSHIIKLNAKNALFAFHEVLFHLDTAPDYDKCYWTVIFVESNTLYEVDLEDNFIVLRNVDKVEL